MKAVIVSSSYSYLERTELLKEAYEQKGYDTLVVMTDFVHAEKRYVDKAKKGYLFVKTKAYYKNISPRRLYSHYCFAVTAYKEIEKVQPDLLHILIPANSLAWVANRYKKTHPEVKLYMDFIDLWPETMPISHFKNTFPFRIWKNLRDKNLERTDAIYCECDMYKEVLGVLGDERYKTLYWAKNSPIIDSCPRLPGDSIHLCYLGSINNIIDMDLIVEICKTISAHKSVVLHIVGMGERKEEFLQLLQKNSVKFIDHGEVYDDTRKQRIFDQCHFGLNIMKKSVCVGLTMKSLDYFKAQLPIINNIKGDTTHFVNTYSVGFNDYKDYINVINEYTELDYIQLRNNVRKLYEEKFTKEAFFRQMQ